MMWDENVFRCRVADDIVAGFYDMTLHRKKGLAGIDTSVYTTIVAATASDAAPLQFLAPYTGTAKIGRAHV